MSNFARHRRRSLLAAATTSALLAVVPSFAQAAGTQAIDKTVSTKCYLDPRPAVEPRLEVPLDVRVRATTDAWAPLGSQVTLSDVSVSLVLTGESKAALRSVGATSFSLGLYSLMFINSPHSTSGGGWDNLVPENSLVTTGAASVAGDAPTEIPLTGPNARKELSFPLIASEDGGPASVELWNLDSNVSLSGPWTGSEANQYDLVCGFELDGDTRVAFYPATAPAAVLPSITSVLGRAIPNVGGFAIVEGERLKGAKSVTVGGKRALFTPLAPNRLAVVAPPLPRGTYPVVVTTSAGASAASAAATLRY